MSRKHDWRRVAHTFNGYEEAGSFEACASLARDVERRLQEGVPLSAIPTGELRTALFFASRAERHGGYPWDDAPRDAIVDELVRRNGANWLDAQVAKPRPG